MLLLVLICAASSVRADTPYDPTAVYEESTIEGWRVLVNQRLPEADPGLCENTLALLRVKLFEIARIVPEPALSQLREIPIWIEHAHPGHPCMCYHVSREWLTENGFNPEKEGVVEIANAANFIGWSFDQPWMVLHELAHGYHHRVLTYDHEALIEAFDDAVESGRYDSVLRVSGQMERHYALSNSTEYFAEGTEAFFGVNDFYPFVRAELREHDPELCALLGELWGVAR